MTTLRVSWEYIVFILLSVSPWVSVTQSHSVEKISKTPRQYKSIILGDLTETHIIAYSSTLHVLQDKDLIDHWIKGRTIFLKDGHYVVIKPLSYLFKENMFFMLFSVCTILGSMWSVILLISHGFTFQVLLMSSFSFASIIIIAEQSVKSSMVRLKKPQP